MRLMLLGLQALQTVNVYQQQYPTPVLLFTILHIYVIIYMMNAPIGNSPEIEQPPEQVWAAFKYLQDPSGTIVSWTDQETAKATDDPTYKEIGTLAAMGVVGGGTLMGGLDFLEAGRLSDSLAVYALLYFLSIVGVTSTLCSMYPSWKNYVSKQIDGAPSDSKSANDVQIPHDRIPSEWERRAAELDGAVLIPAMNISADIHPKDFPKEIGVGTAVISASMLNEVLADIQSAKVAEWSQKVDKWNQI